MFLESKNIQGNQIDAVADNNDPVKVLQEDFLELQQYNPDLVSEKLTAEDVVNTDLNVITTDAPTTYTKILESTNLEKKAK